MEENINFIIDQSNCNQPLDIVLQQKLDRLSNTKINSILISDCISVNNQTPNKQYITKVGDKVTVINLKKFSSDEIIPNKDLKISIIHQDRDLICINKPLGMPCHPNDSSQTETVANWVIAHYPETNNVGRGPLQPGLIHRIDNFTTGVLLIARNQDAYESITQQFKNGIVIKGYKTLIFGELLSAGQIDNAIARDARNSNHVIVLRNRFAKGFRSVQKALTKYTIEKKFRKYTLLNVEIATGVMHQIRAHLSFIGHPIVGDTLYQTPEIQKLFQFNLKYHLLHASKIGFLHPTTKKWIDFSCLMPSHFFEILKTLDKMDSTI